MALPANFQFSQASLQDFVDCKRRFYYRYVERLSWPALESEPALENERYMQRGAAFHHLVHQYILGIPEDRLVTGAESGDFSDWWTSFINHIPYDKKDQLVRRSFYTTEGELQETTTYDYHPRSSELVVTTRNAAGIVTSRQKYVNPSFWN